MKEHLGKIYTVINTLKYLGIAFCIAISIYAAYQLSHNVMTFFGFETKDSVKQELINVRGELARCQTQVGTLTTLVQYKEDSCRIREESVKDLFEKDQDVDSQVSDALDAKESVATDTTNPALDFKYDKDYEVIYSLYKNLF